VENSQSYENLQNENAKLKERLSVTEAQLASLTGVTGEITTPKNFDNALLAGKYEFQNFFENSPDTIYLLNLNGNQIEYMNRESFLGYTQEELTRPNSILPALHSDDTAAASIHWQKILTSKTQNIESIDYRLRAKDGSTVWIQQRVIAIASIENDNPLRLLVTLADITARKISEVEREESIQTFYNVLDGVNAYIYVADLETYEILYMNAQMQADYGSDLTGKLCYQVFRCEDQPCKDCPNPRLITTNGVPNSGVVSEGQSVHNGRWYLNHDRAITWHNGRLAHIQIATDITERKQFEDNLRESETRFRNLFENAADAIHIANEHDEITAVNERMCDLFGYSRQELLSMTISDLQAPEIRRETGTIVRGEVDQYQGATFESLNIHKDGHIFPVELTVSSFLGLQGVQYFCILRDITARKEREKRLQQSEYLLSEAEQVAQLGSFNLDITNGNWTSSQALRQIFGIGAGYETDIDGWLALVHPDDRNFMAAYFGEYIISQHEDFNREYRIIRPEDAEIRWVHGLGKLEYDQNDNPIHLIGTIQDVTARRQAETEIRTWRDRYEAAVQASGHLLYDWDPDTNLVAYGGAITAILGYTRAELEGGLERWFDLIHPDDLDDFNQAIKQLRVSKSKAQLNYRVRKKNGEYILVEDEGNFILNDQDQAERMVGFVKDISEREKTAQILRDSEVRYRSLFEESPIVLWEEDFSEVKKHLHRLAAEGVTDFRTYFSENPEFVVECAQRVKTLNVNQAGVDVYKAPSVAALMNNLEQIFTAETLAVFSEEILTFWEGETHFEAESNSQTLTGQPLQSVVRITIPPGFENTWEKVFVSSVDISERKRFESRIGGLNQLKEDLLVPTDFSTKMKLVTDQVVKIFAADFCRIWILEPSDRCDQGCIHAQVTTGPHVCHNRERCLHLAASSGRYTHLDGDSHGRVPFGAYKIGRVAAGEETKFITNDVVHDPQVHDHEWAEQLGLVSFAGYRIIDPEGNTNGVLALFSQSVITPQEDALLETVANTLSQVITATQSEKALQESESHYRSLFESAPVALWEQDLSGVKIFLDELQAAGVPDLRAYFDTHPEDLTKCFSMIKVLGINQAGLKLSQVESIAELEAIAADRVVAESIDQFKTQIVGMTESERYQGEVTSIDMTGEIVFTLTQVSIPPEYTETWERVFISAIDITAQKRAEAQIRSSEEKYRGLFHNSPIEQWEQDHSHIKNYFDMLREQGITDFERYFDENPTEVEKCFRMIKIIAANPAVLSAHGVKDLAEIKKNFQNLTTPESFETFKEQMVRFAQGDYVYEGETQSQSLTGEKLYSLFKAVIFSQYRETWDRVYVVSIDITPTRQAEAILKRRAEEMATLHAVSLDITTPTEIQLVLNSIVERATEYFLGSGGGLYLCEPEQRQLRYVVSYQNPKDMTGMLVKYGEGVTGIVAETGTPMIVNDYQQWENNIPIFTTGSNYRMLSAPIIWRRVVKGVIHIYRDGTEPEFSQFDLEMLEILANNAAIAIENTRLLQDSQTHAAEMETRVAERTEELTTLVTAMTGREVRLAELKEVIKKLRKQINLAGMTPVTDDPLNVEIDDLLN
jgi:PAS domain S-box-containing protein